MSDVTVVQTTKGHTTIHYNGKMLATISGAGRTREERLELAKKMASSLEHNDSNTATGEKPEVADAVIAEMRERAKFLRDGRELDIHNSVVVFGCYLDETLANLADRLEAALKRERSAFDCECAGIAELAAKEEAARHKPGNAAAMHEALLEIAKVADDWERHSNTKAGALDSIYELANTALAAPARNCDVGSEEEQSRRYEAFCEAHHMQCDKVCSACPCSKKSGASCELYWAQMQY